MTPNSCWSSCQALGLFPRVPRFDPSKVTHIAFASVSSFRQMLWDEAGEPRDKP